MISLEQYADMAFMSDEEVRAFINSLEEQEAKDLLILLIIHKNKVRRNKV